MEVRHKLQFSNTPVKREKKKAQVKIKIHLKVWDLKERKKDEIGWCLIPLGGKKQG